MSCNNIEDISDNMCNKICNDNIPASNTADLTRCNTKCNEKIINELNPLDITNNFIFLNSADVAENALEMAGEQSQELYEQKKDEMNRLISTMETEIQIQNASCQIRIGAKWKKIIDGDNNNEFINIDYIKKFKRYSAFGLKWKNVGNTQPDESKYNRLSQIDGYLNDALISGRDTQNNIILNKKALIDNNLFPNDDTGDLKIYPNSYIELSDNSYCIVYDYPIIETIKPIFNVGGPDINLTDSVENAEIFKNAFFDLTMDDFVINDNGDIYIPSVGCTDFENNECITIENLLSENENCMVDNKDNNYIKRKDTIPYLFHNDAPSSCVNSALSFNNKNELFDIINLITNDKIINDELNEMMGKYEADRYEHIKTRINTILADEYSQYFSTNDFLNLFNNDIQYWITIDDVLFNYRSYNYNRPNTTTGKETGQPTGKYDVRNENITNNYDEIAKILSNYIPDFPSSNHLIQLTDNDVESIKTLFETETRQRTIENILEIQDYFNIIDADGNSTKVILYVPLYEHSVNREDIYHDSHLNYDWSSKSGVDFYEHLNDGQKKIDVNINGSYGQIGYEEGFYNNVILSDDYITKTECEAIKLNAENTSNTIFLNENIENRHNLQEYRLSDGDFTDVNRELTQYDTNIENLNRCIENSKTMINLDTYTKTKEYDNINQNIRSNAEVNKKYNIYLPKVNKYDGLQTDCKFLSEYNNKDTCGISGQMCLSDDFISDTQYDSELQTKKDYLKSYIFNRQKNYYVGKNTKTDEHYKWQITTDYPNIGLELVNTNLTDLLDSKFSTATNSIITLTDDDLSTIQIDSNIDNNTYVISSVPSRYYIVNLQQEDCNQPNDYVLQNSETICGQDKQCAYENEYNTSISEISQYDDNLCTNKYNYLEQCYNQDPDFNMGKQVDYSVCRDDIQSSPQIIDCCPVRSDGTPDPVCAQNPHCGPGSYITYKIENGRYTCEKVCGSCVANTTLNVSDSKCHANIGYYYDYDYDKLESTNPPIPEQCQQGSFIDVTGAKTISECELCIPECDDDQYETVNCTFSTNRVCTPLPANSTKHQNNIDFVCDENYFKRGNQCVKCPNNAPSVQGSTSVSQCIANQGFHFNPQSYVDDENLPIPTDAQLCSDGTFCASGAIEETACPNNTTSVVGSIDISQCYAAPGFYYDYAQHSEGQACSPGYYCPGGNGSTTQNPCPINTYNSLSNQTDVNACNPCDYETTSSQGSSVCSACRDLDTLPASRSAIRQYKYYNYQQPGCSISMGTCSAQQVSAGDLNDAGCPPTIDVTGADGRTITKKQFYGYTGAIERNATTGKPILVPPPTASAAVSQQELDIILRESQEELTRKLRFEDPDMGVHEYILGTHINHECEKTCITCLPNEKFIPTLTACDPCEDNNVADSSGLNCIPCNQRDANTIYDAVLGDCASCNDYQLPNFSTNTCDNPEPGYYVVCDADACVQTEADVNKIVLGQINKVDWVENIKSIIFDFELQPPSEAIANNANNIDIIFRNESWTEDKVLNLPKITNITNNKYYKDISQNIIIFENDTPTSGDFLIKFMESIYISDSDSTTVVSLPNKLILQTENDSYYLLTHRMQQDINDRYSTTTSYVWDNSYLIFDMYLNITNEQYECPDDTYIDNGTAIEASGSPRGTNRNICKFYDSGYYRDIYTSTSGADSSSLSDASTEEDASSEGFTNYENFASRMQTTCLKDFTATNIATIDITESKLGAESGGDYAGCVYKCNTQGHYYNEGTPGMTDNTCEQCPIGYKCDNLQNRTACGVGKYQNQTGQTVCKTIPDGGSAILDDGGANIGFSVPAGKKYNNVNNTITDCSENTYKNTPSVINNLETEREIICDSCPPNNTTTKGVEGSTELAQCIPNFGYTLDISNGQVKTLAGYDNSTGSIQCEPGYYLGDFNGNCDTVNPDRNECTECLDENDKACISCPIGYTCAGGSVDCKVNPALPEIKPGNIDYDPLTAPIYTIDACSPGMKLTAGQCAECVYDGAERNMYCFNGTPTNHVSPSTGDDIKLKNNDNFTPAIYITNTDNLTYNIDRITQDSLHPNDIVFTFKTNYIPAYIDSYLEEDIESLKDTDVPLYLYEHASGERIGDEISNAKNVTQEVGVSITSNTINLLNEGYISNNDTSNNITTRIQSNNLKFTGSEKNELLDIVKLYKNDKTNGIISVDQNLSYIYEFEYYDGSQFRTQSYVYKILPYPSLCDEGTHSTSGLIGSCVFCPKGTFKSDRSATQCVNATGNNYVGVHNLSTSAPAGLGGISVTEMPSKPGFEMLTTPDGGNYGYKLNAGYGYDATTGETTACLTGFNQEQILINNTIDNRNNNYSCGSCPSIASLPTHQQTGLSRLETDSQSFSTDSTQCVIKVCNANYTNTDGDSTEFCELEKCPVGYYFNETSYSCEVCPEGHYCNGDSTMIPSAFSHRKIECPEDTYNAFERKALLSDCLGCPPNTSTNTLLKQTALENCIADSGYYFDSTTQTAKQCPQHTSTDGVAGYTSIANCISNAGYYFDSTTGSTATICPPRKYCPKGTTGPEANLPTCPDNTTSSEGSSSYRNCRAEAGWFYAYDHADTNETTLAKACDEDTYCASGAIEVTRCPNNTNTGGVGQKIQKSDCVSDPGYYYDVNNELHTHAQACPVGTWLDSTGNAAETDCNKCPQDTYSDNTAATTLNHCTGCPLNSSTTYDDAGNTVQAVVEITGKSLLADCKPRKMYKRNPSNPSEMILKPGHSESAPGVYTCDEEYYFDDASRECELCPTGHYCPGGPAESGSAIKEVCPDFSTSFAGSSVIDDCYAISGYKEVGDTNVFVENEGVKTDSNGVVFKPGSTPVVQCEPGYEGKAGSPLECQPCLDGSKFSTNGNVCSSCGTSSDTELVIKECDRVMDVIKIDKSLLRIESFDTTNIAKDLQIPGSIITAQDLYTTYINPQPNTYPNYEFFDITTDDLYFIKLPITYTDLPVTNTANIHSNVTDSDIIDNVIDSSTSSYDKIIEFIDTITSATDILDLCYFWNNGENWEVFLLLPKCGCIPGTYGDNCDSCQIDTGTSRQTFQPGYNQEECIHVPTNIQNGSYTIIQDPSSIYNIGVSLNAGWAMNSLGASYVCAEDTYNASTTDITDQIVNDSYMAIYCTDCADGSGTQDRVPVTGATVISDCTVKFGYTEMSPATTPATYEYDTGYGDDPADGTIDCLPGYYFDESTGTGTCMQCPTGHYCTGGIAQSDVAGSAEKTQCPIGTYNPSVGSIDEDACFLINSKDDDGRGYYGTMAGIDSLDNSSFKECIANTRIDETSLTRTIYDCEADAKWEKIDTILDDGTPAFIVEIQPEYYQDTSGIKCRPGTISDDGGGNGLCQGLAGFDYTQTGGYYLSGLSTLKEKCNTIPSGNIELSRCDAFKNSIYAEVANFKQISGTSGNPIVQCNLGYFPTFLEDYSDTNAADVAAFIDAQTEFYLYEYDSKIVNDLAVDDAYKNPDNFHLNQNSDVKGRLDNIINTNTLKIETDNLQTFKDWVKQYTVEKEDNDSYKLQFFYDVNVYKNDGREDPSVTMRYIYMILPICSACDPGTTSTGYADDVCVDCPAGSKQIDDGTDKTCEECEDGTYQDETGQQTCKPLPIDSNSYIDEYNSDEIGGRMDFKINTGYYWTAGGNGNDVRECPRNTITTQYPAGEIKTNATSCSDCPENQYQATNKYECRSCPDAGTTPGTAYYYNTTEQECTQCGTDGYFDRSSAEKGEGIIKWELKTGIPSPPLNEEYLYCGAAVVDGCDEPTYIYDDTNQMCKLNQCPAGQWYNGVCQPCPAGHYCPSVATTIIETSPGEWDPTIIACESGKYQQNTGQSSCSSCPANTNTIGNAKTNVTACIPNAGYSGNAGGTATICPPGTYKSGAGAGNCSSCPPNTSHQLTGQTTVSACIPNAGYSGNAGGTATICPPGTYKSTASAGNCPSCPSNTISPVGSTRADACEPPEGYYYNTGGVSKQCSAGFYCTGDGERTPCTLGLTSPVGSISADACEPISGYYKYNGWGYNCPGAPTTGTPANPLHKISTLSTADNVADCVYDECQSGYYRNSQQQCVPMNGPANQGACASNEIFVPGRSSGGSTLYSAYNSSDISDYDVLTMYGHDRRCLPVTDICT